MVRTRTLGSADLPVTLHQAFEDVAARRQMRPVRAAPPGDPAETDANQVAYSVGWPTSVWSPTGMCDSTVDALPGDLVVDALAGIPLSVIGASAGGSHGDYRSQAVESTYVAQLLS